MQLDYDEHFHNIVIEAWQAYLRAESRLTSAVVNNTDDIGAAEYAALREGAATCLFLHHFAELVISRHPEILPGQPNDYKSLKRSSTSVVCF